MRTACSTLFVSLPVDHLWRHVQRREEEGGVLQDLALNCTNCFAVALRSFAAMLEHPIADGMLACLVRHWAPIADAANAVYSQFIGELRAEMLKKAAHLWVRLHEPFGWFPFKLLGIFDPRVSREEQDRIIVEFFIAPLCCLDAAFSLKAVSMLRTLSQLVLR